MKLMRGCAAALNASRVGLAIVVLTGGSAHPAQARRLDSGDFNRMRSVVAVALSPDGSRVAYTVENNDAPGRPYQQLWVMTVEGGRPVRIGSEKDRGTDPQWSPDGQRVAFHATVGDKDRLAVVKPDGSDLRLLAEIVGTNSPLTFEGQAIAWSPDSKRIAFVSATPGPETELASGDPVVITRYKYKPDYWEGNTRFNDNRRRHIFVVDAAGGAAKPLTTGSFEEHSIDWSPDGHEIVFVSNREPDPDLFYNPDIFALKLADGSIRRLTATENAEYQPRWSPDGRQIAYMGTRRGLTDLETTMEDTHVWIMDRDGADRRELGKSIDNRQASPCWSADGGAVYVSVEQRGHVRLYRLPVAGGPPEAVVSDPGRVRSWSAGRSRTLAYAHTGTSDLAQVFLKPAQGSARRLTDLNREVLAGVELASVEPFTFLSNDFKFEVEAYLTKPLGQTAGSKHPMIVMIHGGPHGAQGPAFDFRAQHYAGRGWTALKVNFRGSTGYGQAFADAVFRDQNGSEAQDVLYGVSAALRRNPWIDQERLGIEGGSYGGQLTAWLITQTHIFKAAIPLAPIINNLSYNYMTYYNMYEQMEWGVLPHQGDLMDVLWERSALKHVAKVKTPTMLVHGENDNDVPIAESEQFYIALKDVGVETVMVRYPREGHGLREPRHVVDLMDRSVRWYEAHFHSDSR